MTSLITLLLASALFILFGLKIVSYLITYYRLKKRGLKYTGIVKELKVFHDAEGYVPVVKIKNHHSEKVITVIKCYFGEFYNQGDEIIVFLNNDMDDMTHDTIECVVQSPKQVLKLVLSLLFFIVLYSLIIITHLLGWW